MPVAETQAGKSSIPATHPLAVGSVGVTGTSAANRARRGGRRDARGRHASPGLHHRVMGALQESEPAVHRAERPGLRCAEASRHAAGRRRQGRAGGAVGRSSAAGASQAGWRQTAESGRAELDGSRRSRHRPHQHRAAVRCAGDRRRAAPLVDRYGRGLRLRRPAGRAAQALAAPNGRAATTSSTAIRAWATRSPAASASSSPCPTARSWSWSATART